VSNNLRLFIASLALAASLGTQLSAETPKLATETVYTKEAAKSMQLEQVRYQLKMIYAIKKSDFKHKLDAKYEEYIISGAIISTAMALMGISIKYLMRNAYLKNPREIGKCMFLLNHSKI
jgi:uncharacterized membrane protein